MYFTDWNILGLMGTREIVLDAPRGHSFVERSTIGRHISHPEKLAFDGTAEAFARRIVFGRLRTREAMGRMKLRSRHAKLLRELASVVRLEVLDLHQCRPGRGACILLDVRRRHQAPQGIRFVVPS